MYLGIKLYVEIQKEWIEDNRLNEFFRIQTWGGTYRFAESLAPLTTCDHFVTPKKGQLIAAKDFHLIRILLMLRPQTEIYIYLQHSLSDNMIPVLWFPFANTNKSYFQEDVWDYVVTFLVITNWAPLPP